MAYNNNIPQPTHRFRQSQPQLLENFNQIDSWVQTDHVGFNAGGDSGKHTKVTLQQQSSNPFSGNEVGIFHQAHPTSGKRELYVRAEKQNNFTQIPFTASVLSVTQSPGLDDGWTYLPSGILIAWGQRTITSTGGTIFSFSGTSFPGFNAIFYGDASFVRTSPPSGTDPTSAYVFSLSTPGSIGIQAFNTTNGSDAGGSSNPPQVRFLVIGR